MLQPFKALQNYNKRQNLKGSGEKNLRRASFFLGRRQKRLQKTPGRLGHSGVFA